MLFVEPLISLLWIPGDVYPGFQFTFHLSYLFTLICMFTIRKRSCRKVMFLHLSVSHSIHRGVSGLVHVGDTQPPGQTPPSGQTPFWADTPPGRPPCPVHAGIHTPLPSACWDRHGYCYGWYTSYWNALVRTEK